MPDVLPFPGPNPPTAGDGDGGGRPPRLFPAWRRDTLPIDAQVVVRSVLARVRAELASEDRGGWLAARVQRYAKYRGWRRQV